MKNIVIPFLLAFPFVSKSQALDQRRNDQWFLTSQSQTMITIHGPVTFLMGSPTNEKYRTDDELQHQVTIPRSFAISTREITVSQFQKFLEANSNVKQAASRDSSKFPSIEIKGS